MDEIFKRKPLRIQKRKSFLSFGVLFYIFWPSSFRCWRSFAPPLQEIKNDPAGWRKRGSFCAVDRGIGYRFAEQHLCSTHPPPPFCISCPSVCRWWICCVQKRWNNIHCFVLTDPCEAGSKWRHEAQMVLLCTFRSQNSSQCVDRERERLYWSTRNLNFKLKPSP